MSFLGSTVAIMEASNPKFAIKRLEITAARFGLLDQFRVDPYATVVDTLIHPVVMPLPGRHWKAFQPLVDVHLRVNVLNAVVLELRPVLREMAWKIACAAAVGFGRFAGNREESDEVFAFLHLLLGQFERYGDVR